MRSKASRISQSFVSEVGYTLGCSAFRTITTLARVTVSAVAALTKPATVPSRAEVTQEAASDTTRSNLTRPAVALPMILATVLVAALAVAGWQMTRGHSSAPTGQSAASASQTSAPTTLPRPRHQLQHHRHRAYRRRHPPTIRRSRGPPRDRTAHTPRSTW
jgi:hypothetical protein